MYDNSGVWLACGLLCLYPLLSAVFGAWLYHRHTTGGIVRRKK